jgi:hypothetical protein
MELLELINPQIRKHWQAITFIAMTLLSGAIAGTILGILNQSIVEPYIEQAIALKMKKQQL